MTTKFPTMSERRKELAAQRDDAEAAGRTERLALLAELEAKEIAIYERQPGLGIVLDQTDYAKCRISMREKLSAGKAIPIQLACDHCRTQLVNREPGMITASYPGLLYAGCVGCGWIGWVEA